MRLGRHSNLIQRIDAAKPLVEDVAGQLTTEPPIILLEQSSQEIAAKGTARALLELQLFVRAGLALALPIPLFQGALHEIRFGPAAAQEGIDLFQVLPEGRVIDVADDGGQLGAKVLREGNYLASH